MLLPSLALLFQPVRFDPIDGRKLVWAEEFDGSGAIDTKKWLYETGHVRNNEAQEYVTDTANCKKVAGELVITATKDGGNVKSAAIESKQSWLYGYFEIRAQIPTGRGTWPAIWFLGKSIRESGDAYVGWPMCGEIDLMENVGFDPASMHFTVHTGDDSGKGHASKGKAIDVPGVWTGFHTYGLDWRQDHLDFYFDGEKVSSYAKDPNNRNSWPFDKPEFILLNLAIGGSWGGQKGIDDAIFPSVFKVDYVRVYQ